VVIAKVGSSCLTGPLGLLLARDFAVDTAKLDDTHVGHHQRGP